MALWGKMMITGLKGAKQRRMIYFDYAATSPVYPAVLDEMYTISRDIYANPSSLYTIGYFARKILQQSRETLAASIGAQTDEIVFTSGGTEGNNLAVFGVFRASRRGGHLIVGSTEHSSVLQAARALEKGGARLTILPCGSDGRYSPAAVAAAIRPDRRTAATSADRAGPGQRRSGG